MNEEIGRKILTLLDQHRVMTIATLRPDGWPQATTVGYVNEGLTLYFLCGLDSQKAANLARGDRVSLTIDHDTPDLMAITGLSMAARAQAVVDLSEAIRTSRPPVSMPSGISRPSAGGKGAIRTRCSTRRATSRSMPTSRPPASTRRSLPSIRLARGARSVGRLRHRRLSGAPSGRRGVRLRSADPLPAARHPRGTLDLRRRYLGLAASATVCARDACAIAPVPPPRSSARAARG